MPYRNDEYKCTNCNQEYFLLKARKLNSKTLLRIYCANEDCKFYQHPIQLEVKTKEFYSETR